MSKTDSRVSENYCKKLARTRQLNETMKTGLFMIEAKKTIARSSPEAGLHRSQSTAAAPI